MKYIYVILILFVGVCGLNGQSLSNKSYTFTDECPMLTVSVNANVYETLVLSRTRFKAITNNAFSFTDGVRTVQVQYGSSPFADADAAKLFLLNAQSGCVSSGVGVVSVTGTESVSSSTTSGNTTADVQLLSVSNIGAAAGVFDGESIPVGVTLTFTAYLDPVSNEFKRVKSFAYDATGTTFLILETP